MYSTNNNPYVNPYGSKYEPQPNFNYWNQPVQDVWFKN